MVLPHFLEVHPPSSSLLSYFRKHYSNIESSSYMGDTKMIKDDEKWKGWQRNLASSHTPGKDLWMCDEAHWEHRILIYLPLTGSRAGSVSAGPRTSMGRNGNTHFQPYFPNHAHRAHRATQWHPRVSQFFFLNPIASTVGTFISGLPDAQEPKSLPLLQQGMSFHLSHSGPCMTSRWRLWRNKPQRVICQARHSAAGQGIFPDFCR